MSEGIKETKEALVAINELSLKLIKIFGDGFQLADANEILNLVVSDNEVKVAILAAFDGYRAVPEELKDLQVAEVAELIVLQAGYLPKLVDSLKA